MKALFTSGTDVPWSRIIADHRRWLTPVAIVLVINLVVLIAVVMPMRRSAESGTSQAEESAAALNAAIADLKDAEGTRDGQAQASKDLERFYSDVLPENLPSARRLTQLKLAQMARSHEVAFQRGNLDSEELRNSPLERLSVRCDLEGNWDDIRQLIYEIETGPDFIVIDNVALSEGESASAPLSLALEMSTYYRISGNVR
jgi:Tfp pilus assembly protein PilO